MCVYTLLIPATLLYPFGLCYACFAYTLKKQFPVANIVVTVTNIIWTFAVVFLVIVLVLCQYMELGL